MVNGLKNDYIVDNLFSTNSVIACILTWVIDNTNIIINWFY